MVAVQYVPASGLVQVHSTARILGTNELTTQGMDTITQMQGPLYNYAVGLVVPAVLMVVFFIFWCCSLCCAKKCCKGGCSKNTALFFFVLFCSLSLIGWALGLAGNVETTKGFNAMINGVEAVQGLSNNVIRLANDSTDFANNLFDLALNMTTECDNPNVTFPLAGITDGLNSTINAATGQDGVGGIVGQVQGINTQISGYISLVNQYIAWRETGTMIVIVVTMVILTLFMVSTALRVMDSTPECCRPAVRCSSRSTSIIVFLFGILLLLIIWIFVAIIHVIVTIGADLCVPDVNANLNRLANEVAQHQFAPGNPCDDPDFANGTFGILCFYQTCVGNDPFGNLANPIGDSVNQSSQLLQDFKDQLNGTNITVFSAECFNSIDSFFNGTHNITTLVDRAINITSCPEINPVYAAFVYDGFCNGLANGLVFTYVSCIIACVFMMLAMSIFRIFDFHMYEEGRLPEGHYDDAAKGGQVISNGGPITQAV